MGARPRGPREVRRRCAAGLRRGAQRVSGAHRLVGPLNALDRHVALVGFMGAGKSTLGPGLADRLGRLFVSLDAVVEAESGMSVAELFASGGESAFREHEERVALEVLGRGTPAVVELGGGALASERTRAALRESTFAVLLETTAAEAWERVTGSDRPLASDRTSFEALFEERAAVYERVADARARDAEGVVLAAAGVHVERGSLARLADLVPGDGAIAVVGDATVTGLFGEAVRSALGPRLSAFHEVPAGEGAKSLAEAERLWSELRLDRHGMLLGLGGGTTLDLSGFVAASYLRGLSWVPVPTTLVAQVDAAIGGKTGVDLPGGKNLVGAFHWPAHVVIDVDTLETLPSAQHGNGRAEVVKTGLLAGEPLWELETPEQVRRCAAFKAAVCLRDPLDRGERAQLNLGHTFAHALEAASGFEIEHGHAVALGLLAALRLGGLEDEVRMVEDVLAPALARVDRDAAWAALDRDKKRAGGVPRLVLLDAPGRPRWGVEVDRSEIRAALDSVIE